MKILMIIWVAFNAYAKDYYKVETFSSTDTVKCIARFNEINSDDKKIYEVSPMELTLKAKEEEKQIRFQELNIASVTIHEPHLIFGDTVYYFK